MGLWSRKVRVGGCLCVLGSALVLLDLVRLLLSAAGWRLGPDMGTFGSGTLDGNLLPGWGGWWGYAGHLIWVPIAGAKGWQAWRRGQRPSLAERGLAVVDFCIVVGISLLVRFTWLGDSSLNMVLL